MFTKKLVLSILTLLFIFSLAEAQEVQVGSSSAYLKKITAEWKGTRSADGRPKVSDELLERLKKVPIEDAWQVLRTHGYDNQYAGDWVILHPGEAMTGRVVTAQYMPLRPDFKTAVRQAGLEEGRDSSGGMNSWPIDVLKPGDIYVADGYGKIDGGTLIGDNLGSAIYANSKRGVIFNAAVRDMGGLSLIKGFNAWVRGQHPSFIQQMMLVSINKPIRIGHVTVLPGDVVLATRYGVIFIPPQLVKAVVENSEITDLRDAFGHLRIREGKYTPGEIDSKWTDAIKKDFMNWLRHYPGKLPMTQEEITEYFKHRNY